MVAGETVVVALAGGDRVGVVREHWHAPLSGPCIVVDFPPSEFVIAPVATVRRPSESEAL